MFGEIVGRLHVTVQAGAKVLSPALLMAVVTNTRLPQTIGLELAMPGIGVFHLMFLPLVTSHSVTARCPSAFPLPAMPRNDGQFLGLPAVAMGAMGATGASGAERGCVGCDWVALGVAMGAEVRCGGGCFCRSAREHDRCRTLHELDRFCEAAAFVERQRRGHALHPEYSRCCGRQASRRLALYLGDERAVLNCDRHRDRGCRRSIRSRVALKCRGVDGEDRCCRQCVERCFQNRNERGFLHALRCALSRSRCSRA